MKSNVAGKIRKLEGEEYNVRDKSWTYPDVHLGLWLKNRETIPAMLLQLTPIRLWEEKNDIPLGWTVCFLKITSIEVTKLEYATYELINQPTGMSYLI